MHLPGQQTLTSVRWTTLYEKLLGHVEGRAHLDEFGFLLGFGAKLFSHSKPYGKYAEILLARNARRAAFRF